MEKAEGKTLTIMVEASMVSSGIAEIMELQIQGWNYIKPRGLAKFRIRPSPSGIESPLGNSSKGENFFKSGGSDGT